MAPVVDSRAVLEQVDGGSEVRSCKANGGFWFRSPTTTPPEEEEEEPVDIDPGNDDPEQRLEGSRLCRWMAVWEDVQGGSASSGCGTRVGVVWCEGSGINDRGWPG